MNALVGLELLAKDGPERYALVPESAAFLVSAKASFQGRLFRHFSEELIPRWLLLSEVVRSGRPAQAVNQERAGSEFFQVLVEDLFALSHPAAQTLAGAIDWKRARGSPSVLDLGAGSAVWGITLAQSRHELRVTAVDWAEVIPVAQRVVARFGLTERFQFVAGDLLQADFGTGHAVATLGQILHSEGEQRSRALLRKTFDALAPGGTIAIAEFLVNDERTQPLIGLIFAVNMLVFTDNGTTYSFGEIGDWLAEAGFVEARRLDAPGPSPLILANKP
jgi:SAM-dependent methyltransferase